ncbi:MAG: hypothetical protein DWH78_14910 [Planctomycetota bacterium]|nr:MAG: hypothetical protein DWH78_14910 [Planctomycetota bacterium]
MKSYGSYSKRREIDREVDVFLVRTIRRRLVSLHALALMLMIGMATIGVMGLIWHQEAVDDLDFLLHRSPNREHLSRSVGRVYESLCTALDLRKSASVAEMRASYVTHVREAESALFDFRRRIESMPLTAELTQQQRQQVLSRLDRIYFEINLLQKMASELQVISTDEHARALEATRYHAGCAVTRIQTGLETLPAYQAKNWVEMSLQKERERSSTFLQMLLSFSAITIVMFVGILICSFRWISVPVRSIAHGCTRIANGDTAYRLTAVSNWQDEFADVVAGVNCVADRFQQAEEDLLHKVKERSEQLVRSQKLANVGFLAAGVAHEINNPLSAISMAAESLEFRLYELLGMQTQDAREVMDRVAMIRRESRRCGDITARLLDFSRGEKAGCMPVDVAELVREVLVIVHHLGQYQDRTVEFECDKCVIAEVNGAQIKQVILNLVANALQASSPGGVVRIRLQEQVDDLVLAVSDDGCGMDTETLQHVFDPFFTTRETGQGTGLGLSITHRIIEDHGGTVTPLSDGEGCGSTFQIRLPRRRLHAKAA